MAENDVQPDIKEQIRDALLRSAERAKAQDAEKEAEEDRKWVESNVQRVLSMCQNAKPGETLEVVFLEHDPPDATEKRRLAILSQATGLELDKLEIKPSLYRDQPSVRPFSIQTNLDALLKLIDH